MCKYNNKCYWFALYSNWTLFLFHSSFFLIKMNKTPYFIRCCCYVNNSYLIYLRYHTLATFQIFHISLRNFRAYTIMNICMLLHICLIAFIATMPRWMDLLILLLMVYETVLCNIHKKPFSSTFLHFFSFSYYFVIRWRVAFVLSCLRMYFTYRYRETEGSIFIGILINV